MKKFTYLLAALAVMAAVPAHGQYVVTRETTSVVVENQNGSKVVNVEADDNSRIMVQVAGMEIVLGKEAQRAETKVKRRSGVRIARPGHIGFLEVGFNTLPSPDYSIYAGTAYEGNDFMALDVTRSFQWNFCLADFSVRLAPRGIVALTFGLQTSFNNYVFDNPITLRREGGVIVPVDVTPHPKKTKISTWGFQIPVLLELNLPGRIHISGGVYGGAHLDMRTKVKYKSSKDKRWNPYTEAFYYGATVRIGYDAVYVYCNTQLSSLFQQDKGPEVFPLTFGLGFSF